MNDFELSKAIAEALGWYVVGFGDSFVAVDAGSKGKFQFNPCNNWNDLMPLVLKHLTPTQIKDCFGDESMNSISEGSVTVIKERNPQHALAECLLKVLMQGDNK